MPQALLRLGYKEESDRLFPTGYECKMKNGNFIYKKCDASLAGDQRSSFCCVLIKLFYFSNGRSTSYFLGLPKPVILKEGSMKQGQGFRKATLKSNI